MLKGFHGKTLGSLSLIGKKVYRKPLLPLLDGVQHVPFGDADAVERLLAAAKTVGQDMAAVVVEPALTIPQETLDEVLTRLEDVFKSIDLPQRKKVSNLYAGRMVNVDLSAGKVT
jgi:acetylornithine/succinyldiaminopimelate/putrescine aminotransferase